MGQKMVFLSRIIKKSCCFHVRPEIVISRKKVPRNNTAERAVQQLEGTPVLNQKVGDHIAATHNICNVE